MSSSKLTLERPCVPKLLCGLPAKQSGLLTSVSHKQNSIAVIIPRELSRASIYYVIACLCHRRRKKDARLAVEEANRRFYRAFEAGDLKVSSYQAMSSQFNDNSPSTVSNSNALLRQRKGEVQLLMHPVRQVALCLHCLPIASSNPVSKRHWGSSKPLCDCYAGDGAGMGAR